MRESVRPRIGITLFLAATLALLLCCTACGKKVASQVSHPSPSGTLGDVLVVVADRDFNDSEFWALHDSLAQAGYRPVVASASGGEAKGMDGTTVTADLKLADVQAGDYRALAIVGGPGIQDLWDDARLQELARETAADGKAVGAICLAPVVLARAGLLQGKKGTVWSDQRSELSDAGCDVQDDAVVVDGLVVTGNGPDAADEFARAFITTLGAARGGLTPVD
jgi:protease I